MTSVQTHYGFMGVLFLNHIVLIFSGAVRNGTEDLYDFDYFIRDDWRALPSMDKRPLRLPVPYVVIHHTPKLKPCFTTGQCSEIMRALQIFHKSLKWGDIGFNFCVGSEGGVYEGRGWNYIGVHADIANNYSIGICLLGDWKVERPPDLQMDTLKALLRTGVRTGKLDENYKLVGHHQITGVVCPGPNIMEIISTWEHFVPGEYNFMEMNKEITMNNTDP